MDQSEYEVQSIEELDELVLLCKTRTVHELSIIEVREATWGDMVDWRCDVCGAERYDQYDPNGNLLTRYYKPAPRSKIVGERMYAADFRVELLRRYKLGGMQAAKSKPRRRLAAVKKASG